MLSYQITPHLKDFHDAIAEPYVRGVVVGSSPQNAKTTGIDAFISWTRIFAPGPACSFYPDADTGKRAMRERLSKIVKSSRVLSNKVMDGRNAYTDTRIDMAGGNWEVGWVGSTAQTADRSLKYVDMQEVNKKAYGVSREETGPIQLLLKRARSYSGHKIFMSSTPTTEQGNITVLLNSECEVVFVRWVLCPHCHQEILMHDNDGEHLWWPGKGEEEPVDRIKIKSANLGRYICQECGAYINDSERNMAIQRGAYRVLNYTKVDGSKLPDFETKGEEMFRYMHRHRPAYIGFVWLSLSSHLVSISEVVHDYLRIDDPDLPPEEQVKALKDFCNDHRADAYRPEIKARKSDELVKLKESRPESVVPGGNRVVGLVGGIDTQDDGCWYWIHARGHGLFPSRWLIAAGFVQDEEMVKKIMMVNEYKDVDGNIYPVRLAIRDAMGHRTSEVYERCAETHGLILPAKGEQRMATPYATNPVEFYPGTERKKFPWALNRVRVDSNYYKDKANSILTVGDKEGGIRFYNEMPGSYIDQLCAEVIGEESGVWENLKKRPNHLWDCFYLSLCAEDMLRMKDWPDPVEVVVVPTKKSKQKKNKRERW